MSTEARRAPVPPRPTTPPPPPGPPSSMPPPAPSARFPDASPPPADPEPSDDDQDSLLSDLLAPFDRVRLPRPSAPPDDARGAGDVRASGDVWGAGDVRASGDVWGVGDVRTSDDVRTANDVRAGDDVRAAGDVRGVGGTRAVGDVDDSGGLAARDVARGRRACSTGSSSRLPGPDSADDSADEVQRGADDAETQHSPPPPPASARFPDAPPPSTTTRTPAHTADPAPDSARTPPPPADPPHIGVPATEEAEYRLRPPMPPVPPPDAATAGIPGQPLRPATGPGAGPATPPPSPPPPVREARSPVASPAPAHPHTPEPISPPPPTPSSPAPRTAAARRAVGAVDLTPGPGAGRPFVSSARPALYDDSTTRLRPVRTWAQPRVSAAAACVVLGLGLIGGAATGSWLTGGSEGSAGTRNTYAAAGELWHSVPVDQLFPATLKGEGAGPGGADRTWTRVAVAPDSRCESAFDPLLRKALAPAGCLRLLRATYTDATRSHVTTVGLLFTKADADAMRSLRTRFTEEGLDRRPDLMPRPYAAKGTPAADFGDAQRASWTVSVLPDAPVVAFSVSGFADGRTVTEPEPAEEAMKTSATSAPGQAGLGQEAQGIADRVERRLRKTIAATEKTS